MRDPVIVVDDAISHAQPAFAGLGRLHCLPAASITGARLAELGATILIVRSVTRVDRALLDQVGSLRLVGTATAGTDHLDLAELEARGIAFASAVGCNARAVAEWVVAALAVVEHQLPPTISSGPVGVVGLGNVGSRLTHLLRTLGHEVLVCDPPRARLPAQAQAEPFVEFDTLWQRCSIVSFHVPLIPAGRDATLAYVDRESPALAGRKLLINTSRGAVIRDRALDRPDVAAAILDVWDGEPELAPARLTDPRLLLASPHVAGYSLEAKLAATRMMHEAVSAQLERPPTWSGSDQLPARTLTGPFERELPTQVIDFIGDDARVRALAQLPGPARARAFEQLRRGYQLRREFRSWRVPRELAPDPQRQAWLQTVGFELL
ncbi:4-phosphoerythronate dehydrogenase [Enhygromyxa salina]|uniref:Erythronate-4-phosphate dehydrogenase n=1 Tax=Enhygromyxa salina TaxID=215803 RepID=A0A2S9Y134_9BACT|nr:4-phosphoerythronate dehydrogenase [Enhygromyxa salina]PRP98828.1 Erythronate-4-phosphate dehydrogenase [Enhygromyxa salina]